MKPPEPMTRRELLELAALDALDLLDEFEAAIYTRSFHDAPATVQDEVIRLQAEVSGDLSLLPGEEPDSGLRERVLRVVAEAIEREESRLAPLATIGRRRAAGFQHESGRRSWLNPSGQVWRAASFALAGVTVVFALFWAEAYRHGNKVSVLALDKNTVEVLEELIGPTIKDFLFDPATVYTVLESKIGAEAILVINETTREAMLVTDGLVQASDDAYILSFLDKDGKETYVQKFGSTGGLQGIALGTLPAAALTATSWEIINARGDVLLAST